MPLGSYADFTSTSEWLFASFLARMLVQNISQENDLIFKRMNVQVTCIFIQIVLPKDSFCHRGNSQLFIHELAQGAFDLNIYIHQKTRIRTPRNSLIQKMYYQKKLQKFAKVLCLSMNVNERLWQWKAVKHQVQMASLQSSIALFGTLLVNSWWKVLIMRFNTDHFLSLNDKVLFL